MVRSTRLAVAIVVMAGAAAGCTEMPSSGPVIAGDPVAEAERPPPVRFVATEPSPDAEPAEIVDGFIEAMAPYAAGYETAKMFLTPDAAGTWDPSASVTVHRGAKPAIEVVDDDTVRMTMTVTSVVGPDGGLVASPPTDIRQIDLTLQQVDGQWRIADPPDGIIISEFFFVREFEPHNLYFFDAAYGVLVADPIYIPRYGHTATLLTQALLRGPTAWLAPAVRTAFPEGTELAVRSVPVEGGVAAVDLTDQAQGARPDEREYMAAQLAWTLGGIPGVTEIEITADGIPLAPGGEPVTPVDSYSAYDPAVISSDASLFGVTETGVVRFGSDDAAGPVAGPLGEMPDVGELAVNTGGNRAVVIDDTGTELRVATFGEDQAVEAIVPGGRLASPSWDRAGVIWAVDQASTGSPVIAMRSNGEQVPVRAPALTGHSVSRLAVSPDGTRIALVVDGRARVGVVIRDPDSSSIQIDRLRPIGPDETALDVAWSDPVSVAVLVEHDDGEREPYVADLSGSVEWPRGPVAAAAALAAAPGHRLTVGTGEGLLYAQQSSRGWVEFGTAFAPAYPG